MLACPITYELLEMGDYAKKKKKKKKDVIPKWLIQLLTPLT